MVNKTLIYKEKLPLLEKFIMTLLLNGIETSKLGVLKSILLLVTAIPPEFHLQQVVKLNKPLVAYSSNL